MRHLRTIAIVVVWLGLMGTLVRRESTPVPGCSLRAGPARPSAQPCPWALPQTRRAPPLPEPSRAPAARWSGGHAHRQLVRQRRRRSSRATAPATTWTRAPRTTSARVWPASARHDQPARRSTWTDTSVRRTRLRAGVATERGRRLPLRALTALPDCSLRLGALWPWGACRLFRAVPHGGDARRTCTRVTKIGLRYWEATLEGS